jgi:hypothetical protein
MIDLTKIGQSSQTESRTPVVEKKENQAPSEDLRVPMNEKAKSFRKSHWTPDKFVQDGQIRAGEVDEEQKEFLKNTEFVE